MIQVLVNGELFVPWLPTYVRNLISGFEKIGAECKIVSSLDGELGEAVIVVDYKDLPYAIKCKEKNPNTVFVSHSHGSSAYLLGCKATGEREKERAELMAMDLVMCNTQNHTFLMQIEFGVKAVCTGYPIDFHAIDVAAKKCMETDGDFRSRQKGKIVVGGRLEQDRQLFIAVEALAEYGKSVVFCVPHSRAWAVELWGGDTIARYEEIFNFRWECKQDVFYKELVTAEFVATFGCVDTLNLSIIEGISLGCYPIVPHKAPYLEYLSLGYDPYSIECIRALIERKPSQEYSIDKYSARWVAARYVKAIKEFRQ